MALRQILFLPWWFFLIEPDNATISQVMDDLIVSVNCTAVNMRLVFFRFHITHSKGYDGDKARQSLLNFISSHQYKHLFSVIRLLTKVLKRCKML